MTPRAWKRAHHLVLGLLTAAVVVVTLLPIVWMVISSLQTNTNLLTGKISLISLKWRNYVDMWERVRFERYVGNSLIICGATTVLASMFASMAGYALARFRFKGAHAYGLAVVGTQMIPGIMFLLPLYMTFLYVKRTFGIPVTNTYFGMILVYTAFFTPVAIWIMRGFFAGMPRELEEAALIDGCAPFGAFVRVILPCSLPGLIATAAYIFLTAWDELMFAWVLAQTNAQTIPVGIRLYVGQYTHRFDLVMAAAVVTTIPVVVIFLATQRWFIKGLTAGSVKG